MNFTEGFGERGGDKRGGRKGGGNGGDDTQKGAKGGGKSKRGRKMLRNGNEYRHHLKWCRNLHGYCSNLEEDGYCMYAHTLEEWRNANIAEIVSRLSSQSILELLIVIICIFSCYTLFANLIPKSGS
jgi:hypothetical protein